MLLEPRLCSSTQMSESRHSRWTWRKPDSTGRRRRSQCSIPTRSMQCTPLRETYQRMTGKQRRGFLTRIVRYIPAVCTITNSICVRIRRPETGCVLMGWRLWWSGRTGCLCSQTAISEDTGRRRWPVCARGSRKKMSYACEHCKPAKCCQHNSRLPLKTSIPSSK